MGRIVRPDRLLLIRLLLRSGELFEKFTDRARRVVVLSQEEARALDHHHIGTEHLLLGLVREGAGTGAQALVKLGADPAGVARAVEELVEKYRAGRP